MIGSCTAKVIFVLCDDISVSTQESNSMNSWHRLGIDTSGPNVIGHLSQLDQEHPGSVVEIKERNTLSDARTHHC